MDNEQINVLLIEDNPGDARLVKEMLAEAGAKKFNLERVERVGEGLKRLGQDSFHVILLDLSLPDGNGLDTVDRVCNVAPHIPVLILTGLDDEILAIRAVQEGAQDYLVKGQMNSNLLMRALRYAIERKLGEEALRRSEEEAKRLAKENVIVAEIGRIISSTLDMEEVCERFAEELRKLIPFDRIAINIINPGHDTVTVAYAMGAEVKGRQIGDIFPIAGTQTEKAIRTRSTQFLQVANKEELVEQFPVVSSFQIGARSLISVPLISKDQVIGVLNFRTNKPNTYIERDLRLAERVGNQIAGAIANAQLFAEHKRAEKALLESEEGYRTAIENSNDGVAIDKDGLHLFVNKKFLELFGYNYPEEVIGKHLILTVHPDDKDRVKEINLKRQRGEDVPSRYEFKGIRKDGEIIYIEASATKTTYHGGTVSLAYLRDITERKRAEEEMAILQEQFRQSQKMEAIGQLAGGIAHDFNNILTIIKGYSQLSLSELKENDPLRENIKEIQKASERAANLTRQLLAFGRRQVMDVKVLDLNTVLGDLDKMLHRIIGEDIELIRLLAENLGRVKVDPGQIEQVIMNLAVNARDAMPRGGKLTIETANVELDGKYALKHIGVKPGHYVMLSVSDTGCGMTPEVKDRVFEPFFTTKERGKGTGLGLSTVYGIVKQSNGNIWVYSEPGKGTTFKIYLPRVDETQEASKENEVKEEITAGRENVLIVEDDESVRKMAVLVLEKKGYTVLEAKDGNEALLLCKARKEPIHLILTDVVMPGMSGRQLVDGLRKVHQEIKALYMSGYTDNAIVHHGVLKKGMNFIQKPFTIDGLASKVREVLDKSSGTR
jgi:two-component system cell cycle sensor histidine kinase/response regulator CckA